MNQLNVKKGDLVLIVLLLVVAAIVYGVYQLSQASQKTAPMGQATAQIQLDGKLYKTVKLTKEPYTFRVESERGYDVLRVRDYGIEVINSDCPQKICFTFGLITKPYQQIICLPMRMYISIKTDTPQPQDNELDAIVS